MNLIEDLSAKEVIHRMRVSFLVGCDRAERGGVDPTESEIGAVALGPPRSSTDTRCSPRSPRVTMPASARLKPNGPSTAMS